MKLDEQKRTQERFEELFRKGQKRWRQHDVEPLFTHFFELLSKENPKAKVFDIGCGDGWATILSAQKGFESWGLDSSPTGIKEAVEAAQKASVDEMTHFIVGDALQLPYEDNKFDAIIDGGLFHHIIPENRPLYFKNVTRVLKNRGYVYLSAFSSKTANNVGFHFTPRDIETLFGKFFTVIDFEEDIPLPQSPFVSLHYIMKKSI